MDMTLVPVGVVKSSLKHKHEAPRQEFLGAPKAEIHIHARYAPALERLEPGSEILVLTWFDRSDRDMLTAHPRGTSPIRHGVFATRSPNRPNPIGLHQATILDIKDTVVTVDALEALDGTPVIDLKPVIRREREKRIG